MPEPFIVGVKVILLVAAFLLAGSEVIQKRGRAVVAWAVVCLALVFLLRW
jgi:hypothetical protein